MSYMEYRTHRWYTEPIELRISLSAIGASLYVPQLWFFFMDYPFSPHWFSWLWVLPGLPTFVPMGIVAHSMTGLPWAAAVAILWLGTLALIGLLVWLSRWRGIVFWVVLILAAGLSVVSALGAYSAFRS